MRHALARPIALFCYLMLALLVLPSAHADPLPLRDVPEPLKSWVPWVLHGDEVYGCPHAANDEDAHHCSWPGVLQLKVGKHGAGFTQSWQVWRSGWIILPGDAKQWPQQVQVDGKPAAVLQKGDGPALLLEPGNHQISGQFNWEAMPESLALPANVALLQLERDGKPVTLPVRDESNRLWLQSEEKEKVDDQTELHVYRKVIEGVPLLLQTRITLDVSGKARELSILRMLLPNFIAQELQTALPAKLGKDGSLLVQAKPGHWEINLVARSAGISAKAAANDNFVLPAASSNEKDSAILLAEEEVWVYQAAPGIRSVSLEGITTIDSSQTTLPEDWRKLPAWVMRSGNNVGLKTLRRGDANPDPNKLSLEREMWLSFDGTSITVADKIKGLVNQSGRLEMAKGTQLGRVELDGKDQLISIGGQNLAGIELKRGNVQIKAASLLNDTPRRFTATGWLQDMESVAVQLHLPPGWRLLHVSGPDHVGNSWLSRWNLFDFFLVLISSLAVGKLHGRRWGLLALLCLLLAYQEMNSLRYLLLPLLATLSLLPLLPLNRWRTLLLWLQRALLLASLLLLLDFATQQILQTLYPVLDKPQGAALSTADLASQAPARPAEVAIAEEAKPAPPADAPPPPPAALAKAKGGAKLKLEQVVENNNLQVEADSAKASQELEKQVKARLESLAAQRSKRQLYQQSYSSLDPEARVQTGPGLPQWQHQSYDLSFSGLVGHEQSLRLWLIPPWANHGLTLLRLLLLVALLARMVGLWPGPTPSAGTGAGTRNDTGADAVADAVADAGAGAAAGTGTGAQAGMKTGIVAAMLPWLVSATLGLAASLLAPPAQAQLPDKEQLDELKQKLSAAATCLPHCADMARLSLQVGGAQLRLLLDVNAAVDTALPMPGGDRQWLPQQAQLDQKPALMRRDDSGQLWLLIPRGHHQVMLSGPLLQNDSVQLPLPSKPRRVELESNDWDLAGWSETSGAADTLQLTRKVKSAGPLEAPPLPPLLRVERHLSFDLLWRVETVVRRESPPGVPILAAIPLLPGEAVTSADINVKDGKVALNLGPQASEMRWNSTLPQQAALTLSAAANTDWVETWLIDASGRWHLTHTGLVPIQADSAASSQLVFMPLPGEQLQLKLDRPKALDGQTMTLDSVSMQVAPAERNTETTLSMVLRSSRGIEHAISLPAGAILQGVKINGQSQTLRANGNQLILPLIPGRQEIEIRWRQAAGIATHYHYAGPDLHLPASNYKVQLKLPEGRWLLWAGGPGTGPALLFWGKLLLLMLLGYALARYQRAGLCIRDGILLAVGLSQVSWDLALVIAAWFVLVPRPVALQGRRRTLAAVGMGLLSLAMLGALLITVASGLLSAPEIEVRGNGSNFQNLNWYLDRSGSLLPGAWAISLPLMAFRACMLAWALWLAWALLGWLKWGWQCLTAQGGLWQKKAEPVANPGAVAADPNIKP
jgi:hypothetical protein